MFCSSEVFFHCSSVQRFVSRRSSSSVDLVSSSLDDVRAERAAISLSVGLSWSPDRRRRSRGRTSWQQHWERALQVHILHHQELPHGVRLQRPVWWRPGETIDRPLTHKEIAHVKTPRAALAAPAAAAAALVVDEPSSSTAKRREVQVDPIARDWFLDMLDQWKRERQWSIPRCRSSACAPGCSTGPEHSVPLEAELATSSAAPQEDFAVTRRRGHG